MIVFVLKLKAKEVALLTQGLSRFHQVDRIRAGGYGSIISTL